MKTLRPFRFITSVHAGCISISALPLALMTRRAVVSASRTTVVVIITMVTRPVTRWRTAAPAAAIELPSARPLTPYGRGIHIAGALAHPVAFAPDVAMTIPIPEAGCPHITMARRRERFGARRRRCTDVDVDRHLRLGKRQHSRGRTKRHQAGEYYFFHHIK
ncbi:hypothetical protein GWL_20260 [Herbaspirillum sp. GW103]|nr:hypothetical protein GWL_20260 [Herbaspirillum sp. GW103]